VKKISKKAESSRMKRMRNSYPNPHSLKNDKLGYSASHPKIFPKKLISKRKGVRKNDLKQWHPNSEIRDWNIE